MKKLSLTELSKDRIERNEMAALLAAEGGCECYCTCGCTNGGDYSQPDDMQGDTTNSGHSGSQNQLLPLMGGAQGEIIELYGHILMHGVWHGILGYIWNYVI